MPGYGAGTSTGEFSIKPQMLIAQNGKYLVTVAPEPWPGGGDATINVIDLETFRLVLTQPASQEGLRGDWQLGPDGSIQVHGFTRDSAKPAGSKQWLAFLSLPSLRVEDRCDYTVAFNQPDSNPIMRAQFLGIPSSTCAREVQNKVAHESEPGYLQQLNVLLNPACNLESTTIDHGYAVGTCRDCRQSFFGVSCKSERSDVYAVVSKKMIANLLHAPHELTQVLVTTFHGKPYLLSIENAEKMVIYQISTVS